MQLEHPVSSALTSHMCRSLANHPHTCRGVRPNSIICSLNASLMTSSCSWLRYLVALHCQGNANSVPCKCCTQGMQYCVCGPAHYANLHFIICQVVEDVICCLSSRSARLVPKDKVDPFMQLGADIRAFQSLGKFVDKILHRCN